jgi:hypothetical protein
MKGIGAVLYLLGLFVTRFLVVLGAFVVAHAVVASFGEFRLVTVFDAGARFADMRTGMAVVALVTATLWQIADALTGQDAQNNG